MFELGIQDCTLLTEIKGKTKKLGSKPCIVFAGDLWDQEATFVKMKSFFLDFFRGQDVPQIALAGLDHVVVCTALKGKVYIRHYTTAFKRSGTKVQWR